MKTTLFKKDLPELTKDMTQGNLNGYTFVRRDGIAESFEGTEIKYFSSRIEATTYLKELFADYVDEFPEVFINDDWYSVNGIVLFPMINKWAQDNNIPYAGWQDSYGNHNQADDKLYVWLPMRVKGKFAFVGSYLDDKRAGFGCGYEGTAHLSVSFDY